jgi:hypothetical protein
MERSCNHNYGLGNCGEGSNVARGRLVSRTTRSILSTSLSVKKLPDERKIWQGKGWRGIMRKERREGEDLRQYEQGSRGEER